MPRGHRPFIPYYTKIEVTEGALTVMRDVPRRLKDAAELFEKRNAQYGNNYKTMGAVMDAMYPEGLFVQGPGDWLRLMLQVHRVTKETRYACNFKNGGHQDSMEDLSVYAQMAAETDEEAGQVDFDEISDDTPVTGTGLPKGTYLDNSGNVWMSAEYQHAQPKKTKGKK